MDETRDTDYSAVDPGPTETLGERMGRLHIERAQLEAENERLRVVVDAARKVNEQQGSCRVEAFSDLHQALRALDESRTLGQHNELREPDREEPPRPVPGETNER